MSEANKALARRIFDELWNGRNADLIDELIASDCTIRNPDGDLRGPQGYREVWTRYTEAFPDGKLHMDGDIIAEGDRVAIPYTFTGTHEGELMGIEPTGREVSVRGTTISRYADGKMKEERAIWDTGSLLQQLGVVSD